MKPLSEVVPSLLVIQIQIQAVCVVFTIYPLFPSFNVKYSDVKPSGTNNFQKKVLIFC